MLQTRLWEESRKIPRMRGPKGRYRLPGGKWRQRGSGSALTRDSKAECQGKRRQKMPL